MNQVMIEVSARHVHLSRQDLETLFGPGAELHPKKMLSQPGQYASEERVEVVGPKRSFTGVSVLGPLRAETQVEISLTDARSIGANEAPIRESGVLEGSCGCALVGPAGRVELKQGLIAAKRHIHTTPEDAERLGVKDKETVGVKVKTPNGRDAILGDVVVRVSPSYSTAMHIDTDEANACAIAGEVFGEIVK
ncbi:MAG: phosphate propanoyltransferase [Oscillospiraceae bacterium]|jgi:putative phosphotransacetylase|nr:phosphate propanoyltransferase [Oscillospiraceae bacterium]